MADPTQPPFGLMLGSNLGGGQGSEDSIHREAKCMGPCGSYGANLQCISTSSASRSISASDALNPDPVKALTLFVDPSF